MGVSNRIDVTIRQHRWEDAKDHTQRTQQQRLLLRLSLRAIYIFFLI